MTLRLVSYRCGNHTWLTSGQYARLTTVDVTTSPTCGTTMRVRHHCHSETAHAYIWIAALGHDKAQNIIDQITAAYETGGGPPPGYVPGGFGAGPFGAGPFVPPPGGFGLPPPSVPFAPGGPVSHGWPPRPPFPPPFNGQPENQPSA